MEDALVMITPGYAAVHADYVLGIRTLEENSGLWSYKACRLCVRSCVGPTHLPTNFPENKG